MGERTMAQYCEPSDDDLGIVEKDEAMLEQIITSAPLVERIDEQIVRRNLPHDAITSLGVDKGENH